MKFDFNNDTDAMAALHTHLTTAFANHGATFILVPLADIIGTAGKSFNLNEREKAQLITSLCDELKSLLQEALA